MDHRPEMRVVEIEDVGAKGVERCGIQYVHPLAAPEDRRLRPPSKFRERGQRRVDGFVPAAAERAACPIEQRALGFVVDRYRDRAPARFDHKARELPGNPCARCIVHYSPRMPFSLMIVLQRVISALMNAPNSSGVLPTGSAPSAASCCVTSGSCSILVTSLYSFVTISGGVPFTANMPFQPITS